MAPGSVAHHARGWKDGDRRRPEPRDAADPSGHLHGPARAARGAVAAARADRHADSHRNDRGADGRARRAQPADRADPRSRETTPAHAGRIPAAHDTAHDAADHRQRLGPAALRAGLARPVADRAAHGLYPPSPKLMELRELIGQLVLAQGRKVVVFSQWRRMLRLAHWATRGAAPSVATWRLAG